MISSLILIFQEIPGRIYSQLSKYHRILMMTISLICFDFVSK